MKFIIIAFLILNLFFPALAQTVSENSVFNHNKNNNLSLYAHTPRDTEIRFKKKPATSPGMSEQPHTQLQDEKNPWIAAGFSLLLPGSGQMYAEERIWPEILITAGMALAVVTFIIIDQQRAASIKTRNIEGQGEKRIADAHWDALTLVLQIAVPSLWLWNAGDAYHRVEMFKEKVTGELDSHTNAYIIEENLVSVTLWQF